MPAMSEPIPTQLTHYAPCPIQALTETGVQIDGQHYDYSVRLGHQTPVTAWAPNSWALSLDDMAPFMAAQPELILLGWNDPEAYITREVLAACHQHHIGIELMNLRAACRTYNIVVSDQRPAVAGLVFSQQLPK